MNLKEFFDGLKDNKEQAAAAAKQVAELTTERDGFKTRAEKAEADLTALSTERDGLKTRAEAAERERDTATAAKNQAEAAAKAARENLPAEASRKAAAIVSSATATPAKIGDEAATGAQGAATFEQRYEQARKDGPKAKAKFLRDNAEEVRAYLSDQAGKN